MMNVLATLLLFAGVLLVLLGVLWFLAVAFEEGFWWGVGCLFIPVIAVAYLIINWPRQRRPLLVALAGKLVILAGIAVLSLATSA
jgi:hypothetical protein